MENIKPLRLSPEYQLALDSQEQKFRQQLNAIENTPWDRWSEGLAIALTLFALTKALPMITSSAVDMVIVLVGVLAPLAAFSYRIHRVDRRTKLLASALNLSQCHSSREKTGAS